MNIIVISLILIGAVILLQSALLTKRIFKLLTNTDFYRRWRSLFILMIFFFLSYIGAAYIVFIGKGEYLELLSGVVFFSGALFVYLVVRTGLLSFKKLKKANDELEKSAKELKAKNKDMEQITYITSHDLQEPVRTIISFVELLKKEYEGKLDGYADRYLGYISESSHRMSDMIKGLLDFSQLGKDKSKEEVSCGSILESIKRDLSALIDSTGSTIQIDKLPKLQAFEIELRLLFQNLITNAIKFRKKDIPADIKISAKDEDTHWTFAVKDNGIGIEENHIHKIFLLFQRLHTREEFEGTGIGLANCKKIIDLHGGKIWAKSIIGEGSTFYFTLPK